MESSVGGYKSEGFKRVTALALIQFPVARPTEPPPGLRGHHSGRRPRGKHTSQALPTRLGRRCESRKGELYTLCTGGLAVGSTPPVAVGVKHPRLEPSSAASPFSMFCASQLPLHLGRRHYCVRNPRLCHKKGRSSSPSPLASTTKTGQSGQV